MVFNCLWTVYLHVCDLCLSACVCRLYIPACVRSVYICNMWKVYDT